MIKMHLVDCCRYAEGLGIVAMTNCSFDGVLRLIEMKPYT